MTWELRDLPAAFDVIVRSRRDWEKWSRVPVAFEHRVAATARVVYDAAA